MAKVFLSAGHGGADSGAVGYGLKEKDINLQILLACREELVRHGVTVVCSRITDENDPVAQEVTEANKSKSDVAVSFHTNAGGGDGSETFYYSTSSKGKKLAELCEKHTKAIGQNSRGIKTGNHLWFIKQTTMPAVLCECAFIDNNKDNDIIDTVAEQRAFGVAYAKAILEFLGVAYKDASVSAGYPLKDFVRDVQRVTGSKVDGIAGKETLGNTITLSATSNRKHAVVKFVQKRLNALGYSCGVEDGVAGILFTLAVNKYQREILGYKKADGEITAKGKMWRSLLGMK